MPFLECYRAIIAADIVNQADISTVRPFIRSVVKYRLLVFAGEQFLRLRQ